MEKKTKKDKREIKRLKNMNPQVYVDFCMKHTVVSDKNIIGNNLIWCARRSKFKIDMDMNTRVLADYLIEMGLLEQSAEGYKLVDTWKELLGKRFPKAKFVYEVKSSDTEPIVEATTETVVETVEASEKPEMGFGSLRNYVEFYTHILKNEMWSDFTSKQKVKELIESTYTINFGAKPAQPYWYARLGFLERNHIIEGIEDGGETKYLRSTEWEKILENKSDGKLTKEFEFNTPKEEPVKKVEEPVKVQTPEPKPEKVEVKKQVPAMVQQNKKTILVSLSSNEEVGKVFVKNIAYQDDDITVVELETIQGNLDTLKVLTSVKVNDLDKAVLRECYSDQIKYYENQIKILKGLTE